MNVVFIRVDTNKKSFEKNNLKQLYNLFIIFKNIKQVYEFVIYLHWEPTEISATTLDRDSLNRLPTSYFLQ